MITLNRKVSAQVKKKNQQNGKAYAVFILHSLNNKNLASIMEKRKCFWELQALTGVLPTYMLGGTYTLVLTVYPAVVCEPTEDV